MDFNDTITVRGDGYTKGVIESKAGKLVFNSGGVTFTREDLIEIVDHIHVLEDATRGVTEGR